MSNDNDPGAPLQLATEAPAKGPGSGHHRRHGHNHHRRLDIGRSILWAEGSITTTLGASMGLGSEREHSRLYRATLRAVTDGLIIGRGRHGVVVALTNDQGDSQFSLAVKIVSKIFTASKGKEPSFHRVVSHTLHLQNEVAAMAKLTAESTFVMPLYCAFQDDAYVYLVMERACCSLKQLIQHANDSEREMLLAFQEAHPLKFLSFCLLSSAALLHVCWTLQRARLIHHDIHPAQLLVTSDGRPRLADLGQCSVIPADGRKQLLPPLGRRDFCRPPKLGPLQGAEVDGYGAGATLWVAWKGCYDGANRIQRDWNRHDEREALQRRLEFLSRKAAETAPAPRWPFAQRVQEHLLRTTPHAFAEDVRTMIEALITACEDNVQPAAPVSSFSAQGPFALVAPFLSLDASLATDPSVTLEPANFALPAVVPEEAWPPPDGSALEAVYAHAIDKLFACDTMTTNGRRRSSRVVRPMLPELPIALNATPCASMLLHPGRVVTTTSEPLIRIAIVSMLVRESLPEEMGIAVHARPWKARAHDSSASAAPALEVATEDRDGGESGGEDEGASGKAVLDFAVSRNEFTQEGPSGPVEAKRVLMIPALPHRRMLLTFELLGGVGHTHGFCMTPPLLLEHRLPPPTWTAAAAAADR